MASLKIFHTADIHIGMKFNGYPGSLRIALRTERIEVIKRMIQVANDEGCQLFVIAGDLFHSVNGIDKSTKEQVLASLEAFKGECVVVMPGNHDYDSNMVDLWDSFKKVASKKILFINQEKVYSLEDYDLGANIYSAPCHAKHSNKNSLGWIEDEVIDKEKINIGIAHGSLEGISPDPDMKYYFMTRSELHSLPMDIWLLGHTHVPYPSIRKVAGERVFNPGTPEPDGLDCKHHGSAWIITIDDNKEIEAHIVDVGGYHFIDQEFKLIKRDDIDRMYHELVNDCPEKTIARLHIRGSVEEDVYVYRQEIYRKLDEDLAYFQYDDDELGIKITREMIHKEFLDNSFPQKLLMSLSEDEEAMQMAYELIKRSKNDN
jgi:DNA repair exonuclease SbcCD nuclease subunit